VNKQTDITGKTLGRFKLARVLGEGAQGAVYLAQDAHLGRAVAIKTLRLAPLDRVVTVQRLLQEARTVSKLSHPHIVALYDAGESEGAPYLVFEYVPGETLAQVLGRTAPLPTHRAVAIAIEILEGVAHAHAHGVLHRDLKPANIIFDAAGQARIMDFGISTPMSAPACESFAATPLYTAPEYLARGEFLPQSDLYAVGAVLYEMLTGQHAVQGKSVQEILQRVQRDEPLPPSRHAPAVDEQLDALVLRALAKRPDLRFASAREMVEQLQAWLAPPPATPPTEVNQSTIEFLLRRMHVKSEFPALSETIRSINRIAASDKESAGTLARVILKDFALTNRLLKRVNAATYGQYGKVSTISRAVVIVGFEVVRSMAVTLLFLDHLQNKAQAGGLKEDVVGSLFSGLLARQIAGGDDLRDSEELFICAIYQNLGRLLATYYFYEESQEIERLMASKSLSEARASNQVLGVSYEQLGIEIAKSWNFPERIVHSMGKLGAGKVPAAKTLDDRVRVIANLADELRVLTTSTPAEETDRRLNQLGERYASCLRLDAADLKRITQAAVLEITKEASFYNLDINNSGALRQARHWGTRSGMDSIPAGSVPGLDKGLESLAESDLEKTLVDRESKVLDGTPVSSGGKPSNAVAILSAGVQDITNTLVSDYKLNDLLNMVMETMYRGMGFTRVLLAVRDARSGLIVGRFALGEDSDALLRQFSFPLAGNPDLFRLAVAKGRDILISDAHAEKLHAQLPEWYRTHVHAPAFVLFPILVGTNPVGLIYADMLGKTALQIAREEANLLVTLRNQAVLAFKQASLR
jgi:serine/threonine protein kinase